MLSFKLEVPIGSPIRRLWRYLIERRGRILAELVIPLALLIWAYVILARDGAPWYSWFLMTGIWLIGVVVGMVVTNIALDKVPLPRNAHERTGHNGHANRPR
jgi:hypothetical protein